MAGLEDSLEKVFSGALVLLSGYVLGGVLTLAIKILLARFFQPGLYGVFSQSLALVHVLVILSIAGLNAGTSRFMSFNSDSPEKGMKAVPSSLVVVMPLSLLVFATLFFLSGEVSQLVFGGSMSADILRLFAVAGPAMAFNSIIISGFRGLQKSRERVVLLDFVIPALQILGISGIILAGYGLFGATAGYVSAFLVTSVVAGYWYFDERPLNWDLGITRELVNFSWPIMISSIAVQVFLWSPPLVLGALGTPEAVGLLNAALPLAAATRMFLSSASFLFMPVVAEHYSRGEKGEIGSLHATTTKWIFNFSLPVLAFLAVFSGDVVSFLFGESYQAAGAALTVMAAGYLFNTGTGPLGDLLIATGRIKKEMTANVSKLSVFGVVGLAFIPGKGFLGAAIAFSAALALGDMFRAWFARDFLDIGYLARLLKPALAVLTGLCSAVLSGYLSSHVVFRVFIFGISYFSTLVLLNPFDDGERELIRKVEERTGIPFMRLIPSS